MYRRTYPQLPPRRDATRRDWVACSRRTVRVLSFFFFFLFFRGLPNLKGLKRFPWGWRIAADRLPTEPLLPRFVSSRLGFSPFQNSFRIMIELRWCSFFLLFFMEVIIYSLWLSFTASTIYLFLCKLLFMFVQASRRLLHRLVLLPKSRRLSR